MLNYVWRITLIDEVIQGSFIFIIFVWWCDFLKDLLFSPLLGVLKLALSFSMQWSAYLALVNWLLLYILFWEK